MLIGSFQSFPWATGIATTSAVWSAVYMLWMFKRVMHGKVDKSEVEAMPDLTLTEKWAMAPLVAIILWIGIYPMPLVDKLNGPAESAAATTFPARTAPDQPVGTVLTILGRSFIPDRHDSRDLHYLPVNQSFGLADLAAGSKE